MCGIRWGRANGPNGIEYGYAYGMECLKSDNCTVYSYNTLDTTSTTHRQTSHSVSDSLESRHSHVTPLHCAHSSLRATNKTKCHLAASNINRQQSALSSVSHQDRRSPLSACPHPQVSFTHQTTISVPSHSMANTCCRCLCFVRRTDANCTSSLSKRPIPLIDHITAEVDPVFAESWWLA